MLKKAIHFACVWITALCVLAQSVGVAAGGVLCLGCTDAPASWGGWGGISVTSAPCTPVNDCCAQLDDQHDSHLTLHTGGHDFEGCGCFDVTLKSHDSTLARPLPKIILSFSHVLGPVPTVIAMPEISLDRPMWGARAGPPSVRLLVPLARRTVLLI